jgi:hypothetical protein
LAHVPDGNMRRDTATDESVEEFAGAVGSIGGKIFRLEPHSFVSPLDHRFRRRDLVVGSGGGKRARVGCCTGRSAGYHGTIRVRMHKADYAGRGGKNAVPLQDGLRMGSG